MGTVPNDVYVASRQALHAVADWVLAPLRFSHDGHIGLRATPGGFGHDLARVEDRELVTDRGRAPLTTLADAAAFASVEPGRHSGTYEPETPWRADASLAVDRAAAAMLAAWFAHGTALLEELVTGLPARMAPTTITLWPEHFDLGTTVGPTEHRVNVGASPGDADHPLPYLYVGPWHPVDRSGPDAAAFWNEPFGASLAYEPSLDWTAATAFLWQGLERAW